MAGKRAQGLEGARAPRRDAVATTKLDASTSLRVKELARELKQSESATLRALISAALGDEASVIAAREARTQLAYLRQQVFEAMRGPMTEIAEKATRQVFGGYDELMTQIDDDSVELADEIARKAERKAERVSV